MDLSINKQLYEALAHPLWLAHQRGDTYTMDGKGCWTIYYYPIFANGKTQQEYAEPRALMMTHRTFKNGIEGMDLREVPLRYIEKR